MSRPRLTPPLTHRDGSPLLLRSAISPAANPLSCGVAAASPEEFTSSRWKPPDWRREGRPLAPFWPRAPFACWARDVPEGAVGFGAAAAGIADLAVSTVSD